MTHTCTMYRQGIFPGRSGVAKVDLSGRGFVRDSQTPIFLPVSQTLGRDLDCHASTTKEGKDKRKKYGNIQGVLLKTKTSF